MRWAIFYADLATYSHEDGSHRDAPHVGVVAIVQDVPDHGVQILIQSDLYWWRDGIWWAGDIFGLVDQSARFGASWAKQGQTIKSGEYAEILGRAAALKAEWDG